MKSLKLLIAAAVLAATQVAGAAAVDSELVKFVRLAKPTDTVRVIALVQLDRGIRYPNRYDSRAVLNFLRARANNSAQLVRKTLSFSPAGQQVAIKSVHWINNSIVADVTPAGLKALARTPSIERIYLNRRVQYDRPVRRTFVNRSNSRHFFDNEGWAYDMKDMGIDKLFESHPEIDGRGVVVGSVDTGVDGKHPALAGKIIAFYDAQKGKVTEPFDADEHGTHTAGTEIGGDRAGVKIGMAPGAKMIATAALTGYNDMLKGMEWMLDPDNNPNTTDFPRVINNSWNCQGAPDVELFYRAISAWEAAGILPVFSAGNAGPGDKTITRPHEHPQVLATAATGDDSKVASFSSRGPATYHGETIQKPDVSAPGVDIVSSLPGGKYAAMSGTSMASPHVTGLVALLMQMNPKLNPQQLRELVVKSSQFVDVNGSTIPQQEWNKSYGFGRANAYSALKMLAKGMRRTLNLFGDNLMPEFNVAVEPQINKAAAMTADDFGQALDTTNTKWVQARDLWADY